MSNGVETSADLSGSDQVPAGNTYSVQRYLASEDGVTDRLLKGLNTSKIANRVQTVTEEAKTLADQIARLSNNSS